MTPRRRSIAAAAVAAPTIVLACTACEPGAQVADGAPFLAYAITHYGSDTVVVAGDDTNMVAHAAASNEGAGNRVLWVNPHTTTATTDHTICVTWAAATSDFYQPGLLLRWDGNNGLLATRNVWGYTNGRSAYTLVNLHAIHPDLPQDQRLTQLDGRRLEGITAPDTGPLPLPWRACARAAGPTVTVKVWALSWPEPAWGDPRHGYTTTLPAELVHPGRPGWYAGHIPPGQAVTYRDTLVTVP